MTYSVYKGQSCLASGLLLGEAEAFVAARKDAGELDIFEEDGFVIEEDL